MHAESNSSTAGRELLMTRVFNAPRTLVFKVWTSPEHVGHWWGPKGFTTTTHEMDVRPGGTWRYTMHGPEGRDFPNVIVFDEVVDPELLRYSHGSGVEDDEFEDFNVTITFRDLGGRTELTMHTVFPTVEGFRKVVEEYGAIEGAKQMMERFEAYLAALS